MPAVPASFRRGGARTGFRAGTQTVLHPRPAGPAAVRRRGACAGCRASLKENLAALPAHGAVSKVEIPELGHTLDAGPGKMASCRIYAELRERYGGRLDKAAAEWALEAYGEFVQEAKDAPGSHPNIDVLLDVVEKDLVCTVLVEHSYLTIERVRPGDGATFPEKGQIVSVSAARAAAPRGAAGTDRTYERFITSASWRTAPSSTRPGTAARPSSSPSGWEW